MKRIILLALIIGLFGCNQQTDNRPPCCMISEYSAQAVLWYQHSPEMQALYIQSYNTAKMALAYNIEHKMHKDKKSAVVFDIDETILSNSPYQAWLYLNDNLYSGKTWNDWVNEAKAEPLPGTVDFLNYVKNSGCEAFYVTNRSTAQLSATLQNLKRYNLPFADENHLLLKSKGDTTIEGKTTKEKRRLYIENELNFEILLLCGDQMADFDKAFDITRNGTENQIKDSLAKYQERFSTKFIVIPNPMYCDWLNQIVIGNSRCTNCQNRSDSCIYSDSLRRSNAIGWKH